MFDWLSKFLFGNPAPQPEPPKVHDFSQRKQGNDISLKLHADMDGEAVVTCSEKIEVGDIITLVEDDVELVFAVQVVEKLAEDVYKVDLSWIAEEEIDDGQ